MNYKKHLKLLKRNPMKKIYTLLAAVILTANVWSQSPEKMSYQAVVRNSTNNLIPNQGVGMQISILQGSVTGSAVYIETQTPTTNANGLVSLEIGTGIVVSGDFTTIDWGNSIYFIKTETDLTGGTTYTITGTSQLMSVPYALYAKTSGSSTPGPQGVAGNDGANGTNGLDGAIGATGLTGTQGLTGTTGPQGATGPQGLTGANGTQGLTGVMGPQGATGAQGITGTNGTNGINGTTGLTGTQGLQGVTGNDGADGTTGLTGVQGLTGAQGIAGTNGIDGATGLTGTTGLQGDPATDDQCLAVSQTGDTLYINGCSTYVIVNGISSTNYPTIPIVNFTASSTNITEGNGIIFADNSTNNPTIWLWDFGDGGTSTIQNPTYTYLNNGVYTVTLTVTNVVGSATDLIVNYITVNDISVPLLADFSANPTAINVGDAVVFTDNSTNNPTTWSWDFGDGNLSSLQNPTNIYLNSGIYTVSLIAGGDTVTHNNYIYVSDITIQPVADFIVDDTIRLENEIMQFTDLSINTPVIWTWNFGDGNTSPMQNPTHSYSTTGDYEVSLTATNMYGGNTIVKTNYIHVGLVPVTSFTAANQNVTNAMISFTDASANAPTAWLWNFGDGNTSTLQNPTHAYTVLGTYDVTLIATNMFGTDTLVSQSFISLPPIAMFYANQTTVTGGTNVQFTDQSLNTPTAWSWNFGDGTSSTLQNPTHSYSISGVYNVILTVTSGFGVDTLVMNNYINVTSTNVVIGDYAQGGVVFWLDGNGGGLICDVADLPNSEWGCHGSSVSGPNGSVIGTGAQNTINIVNANCSPYYSGNTLAANECSNLTIAGFSDWFLPSNDELAQMYANKTAINTAATANGGSSFSSSYYWSSTEYLGTYARRYSFYSGSLDWAIRYQTHRVRAVRAF